MAFVGQKPGPAAGEYSASYAPIAIETLAF